jgi:cation diffusion facilitator family transporter
LALLKILGGVFSGSLAVLSDGIDSTTDVVASIITLFTARIISKPADKKHPYGHSRAETIATKVLAFIIFFVGAQLAYSTVMRIIAGTRTDIPSALAFYVSIISILGKIVLTVFHFRSGKKTQSSMLIANGKNMQSDVLISISVLIGLAFTYLLHIPILDSIAAVMVSLWIMKTAFQIFMESNTELMDGMEEPAIYTTIFQAVESIDGVSNPHRTRVRRLAHLYIIDIDVEVDGKLSVAAAHQLAVQVEETIKQNLDNVYDIMVHVEPLGNVEQEEKYGISGSD